MRGTDHPAASSSESRPRSAGRWTGMAATTGLQQLVLPPYECTIPAQRHALDPSHKTDSRSHDGSQDLL